MRLEHHLVGGYVRYISPYIIIFIKAKKGVRFLVSARAASDPLVGIFLIFFFLLGNDVQLQPTLLDRLEFCRAVF